MKYSQINGDFSFTKVTKTKKIAFFIFVNKLYIVIFSKLGQIRSCEFENLNKPYYLYLIFVIYIIKKI